MKVPKRSKPEGAIPRKMRRKKSQVPDQFFGYSLQTTRFLQLLLSSPPGSWISLEVFEDVGVENPGGERIASQVKSGLVKNPVADRSVELWKTLANWAEAIQCGILDPAKTIFEIYVAADRSGQIASLFDGARSPGDAKAAIAEARRLLESGARKEKQETAEGSQVDAYANSFFKLSETALSLVIQRFRICTSNGNPLGDVRSAIAAQWVQPESVDLIATHAHGWIKEQLDAALLARKPSLISVDAFKQEILAFLPRCDYRKIISSVAGMPSPEQVEAERVRVYVRQLQLIDTEEEDTLQAINHFLRASSTRTKLSEEGIVHGDSFRDYEEALTIFWRNKRRQNSIAFADRKPEQLGQLLLSDCCLHQQTLQGLELPPYFTPGSFHALADDKTVGWHPEYSTKLAEG